MRKLFLLSMTLGVATLGIAQQAKNYRLTVVAEGNFGTPNGDVFRVLRQNQTNPIVQGPLYQNANNISTGVDVLQDFDFWNTKAIVCGKGSQPLKFAVVNYPNMDTVFTVSSVLGAGLQRCGMVSDHKAYILAANSNVVRYVDIDNQTIANVADPGNHFASGVHSMIGYNATMYVANSTKVVRIDTATQTTSGSIVTGLTAINTMVKDTANQCLWLLGKSGTTNAIVKIEVNNNNTVSAPILLNGFTNAKLLRVGPNKLYFVSGSGFYIYDVGTQVVPTAPVYTTAFTGFSVMYDRSFAVDPVSGDFAYSAAGAFVAPGLFEIIDGTNFSKIDSGAITGAAIPNELFLTTWPFSSWDTTNLPSLYAQCGITLDAPVALLGNNTVTGVTQQLTYQAQGSYIVEWKYVLGTDSITQIQLLTIADTTAPVPDIAQLPELNVTCPYILIPPTATDNCFGTVNGTTDSLTYTTAGNYTLIWTYTDSAGNSATQQQLLTITCDGTSVAELRTIQTSTYPNPANTLLTIALQETDNYTFTLVNPIGQTVVNFTQRDKTFKLNVENLPEGLYLLHVSNSKGLNASKKVIVKH